MNEPAKNTDRGKFFSQIYQQLMGKLYVNNSVTVNRTQFVASSPEELLSSPRDVRLVRRPLS